MKYAHLENTKLHYRIDGPEDGAPVVFANSLGTDLRLWDPIIPEDILSDPCPFTVCD